MATETITQASNLTFSSLPPFPSTIPTAPLHRLSLQKLRTDAEESARLFSSSKDLGFFYLDLRGDKEGESLLQDADELFTMAPKLYDLGRVELSKYDHKSKGSYMGYKGFGSAVVDEKGNLDRNEFYNVCCPFQSRYQTDKIRYQKMISLEFPHHQFPNHKFSMTTKTSSYHTWINPTPS